MIEGNQPNEQSQCEYDNIQNFDNEYSETRNNKINFFETENAADFKATTTQGVEEASNSLHSLDYISENNRINNLFLCKAYWDQNSNNQFNSFLCKKRLSPAENLCSDKSESNNQIKDNICDDKANYVDNLIWPIEKSTNTSDFKFNLKNGHNISNKSSLNLINVHNENYLSGNICNNNKKYLNSNLPTFNPSYVSFTSEHKITDFFKEKKKNLQVLKKDILHSNVLENPNPISNINSNTSNYSANAFNFHNKIINKEIETSKICNLDIIEANNFFSFSNMKTTSKKVNEDQLTNKSLNGKLNSIYPYNCNFNYNNICNNQYNDNNENALTNKNLSITDFFNKHCDVSVKSAFIPFQSAYIKNKQTNAPLQKQKRKLSFNISQRGEEDYKNANPIPFAHEGNSELMIKNNLDSNSNNDHNKSINYNNNAEAVKNNVGIENKYIFANKNFANIINNSSNNFSNRNKKIFQLEKIINKVSEKYNEDDKHKTLSDQDNLFSNLKDQEEKDVIGISFLYNSNVDRNVNYMNNEKLNLSNLSLNELSREFNNPNNKNSSSKISKKLSEAEGLKNKEKSFKLSEAKQAEENRDSSFNNILSTCKDNNIISVDHTRENILFQPEENCLMNNINNINNKPEIWLKPNKSHRFIKHKRLQAEKKLKAKKLTPSKKMRKKIKAKLAKCSENSNLIPINKKYSKKILSRRKLSRRKLIKDKNSPFKINHMKDSNSTKKPSTNPNSKKQNNLNDLSLFADKATSLLYPQDGEVRIPSDTSSENLNLNFFETNNKLINNFINLKNNKNNYIGKNEKNYNLNLNSNKKEPNTNTMSTTIAKSKYLF